ncbi:hypothetical protein IW148_000830 [Coemansia sp. RSA 1199]|nr:hypothetical protein IW148_000830 [Coemansia sp. RSA 1199]
MFPLGAQQYLNAMTAAVIRGLKSWAATTRTQLCAGRPGVLLQSTRSHATGKSSSDSDKDKHIAEKSDVPEAIGFDVGFRDGYEAGFDEGRRRVEAASKSRSATP